VTRFSLGEIDSVQVLVKGGSESSSDCWSVSAGGRGSEHRGKSEIVLQTLVHRQECSWLWGRRAIPVTAFAVAIGVHHAGGSARMSASEPLASSTRSIFSSNTPLDLVQKTLSRRDDHCMPEIRPILNFLLSLGKFNSWSERVHHSC
jgi:hypothetical protein